MSGVAASWQALFLQVNDLPEPIADRIEDFE
jgi:hypothetical protein